MCKDREADRVEAFWELEQAAAAHGEGSRA